MRKLTKKKFWNSLYKSKIFENEQKTSEGMLKSIIKTIFGKNIIRYMHNYSDYLLWNVIYKKYMPKKKGMKVLEIGSAPGNYLVRLSKKFDFIPYGIEFSEIGIKLNRKIFILNKINPDNVIYADFYSNNFHKQYREYFDIVISRGFIEHFFDVEDLIEKHINLLIKGGYLIVSIPNLLGANYILSWIFNKKIISKHNLIIMQKGEFLKLFDKKNLLILFCNYYGTFDFSLFNTKRNSSMRFLLNFCTKFQVILNIIFRLLFKEKGMENKIFSPHLIYIGVKKK